MRDERNQQFAALPIFGIGSKQELAQNRDTGEPWNSTLRVCILILHQAAQQAHFAIAHPNISLVLALRNHGLIQAANGHGAAHV